MLPSGQSKLWQIFSAKYLVLVPENTLNGLTSLMIFFFVLKNVGYFCAKVAKNTKRKKDFMKNIVF